MISKKISKIQPFIVMEVMEEAAEMERRGEDIIHLEVGEPDFDTPRCIKSAAIQAIREGKTHYTHSLGLRELREVIAEHYDHVAISAPNQLVVTFKPEYTHQKEACERIERRRRLEQAVSDLVGCEIRIEFQLSQAERPVADQTKTPATRRQRMRQVEKHPLVKEIIEVFDAEVREVKGPPNADH